MIFRSWPPLMLRLRCQRLCNAVQVSVGVTQTCGAANRVSPIRPVCKPVAQGHTGRMGLAPICQYCSNKKKRVGTGFTPVRPDPANTGAIGAPRTGVNPVPTRSGGIFSLFERYCPIRSATGLHDRSEVVAPSLYPPARGGCT
jgi:hypothetical protein